MKKVILLTTLFLINSQANGMQKFFTNIWETTIDYSNAMSNGRLYPENVSNYDHNYKATKNLILFVKNLPCGLYHFTKELHAHNEHVEPFIETENTYEEIDITEEINTTNKSLNVAETEKLFFEEKLSNLIIDIGTDD